MTVRLGEAASSEVLGRLGKGDTHARNKLLELGIQNKNYKC